MDNNNPLQGESVQQTQPTGPVVVPQPVVAAPPTPVSAPVQPPAQPAPVVEAVQTNQQDSKGGSKWLIFTIIILIILIGLVSGYLYMTNQNAKNASKNTVSIDQSPVTALDNETNAVDLGNEDDGFSEIDQSLQTL